MKENQLNMIKKKLPDRKPHVLGHENYSKSAVMLPLIEKQGSLHILFEVRADHLRRQPGEICFPGGRVDPTDADAQRTAIRETCEELGIQPHHIEPLAALDFLPTSFGSIIYPFVGKLSGDVEIQPNAAEVAEVFYVPLDYFLMTTPEKYYLQMQFEPQEGFPFHLIPNGKNYNWSRGRIPEYFYNYQDYVIWGLTARILHHFISLIKNEG
jgi:coenzyme A diphosphatase NUDT7